MFNHSSKLCSYCDFNKFDRINSYKHYWLSCSGCGSTRGTRKKRYFFSYFPFNLIINILYFASFKRANFLIKDYLIEKLEVQSGSRYDTYADFILNDEKLEIWKDSQIDYLNRLKDKGFKLEDQRILILSGGPGLLAKSLSEKNEVVVTEFSEKIVNAMQNKLGLTVIKFDLNEDILEDKVKGEFDIIIAVSVANFCNDLPKLVKSLMSKLRPNGKICVSNDDFSLGYALTWQFEDYIPTNFPAQHAFLNLFHQQKREISKVETDENFYNAYLYRLSIGGWKNKICYIFRTPFWLFYGLLAHKPFQNINNKMWSRNVLYYLSLKD